MSYRYQRGRTSCYCDGQGLSAICCGDTSHFRAVMLVGLPLLLSAMFLAAGADRIPVWKLDTGSTEYVIAAQGYKTIGGMWTPKQFAYKAPPDWPEELRQTSLWLLFHFILGILLGVYLIFLGFVVAFTRDWSKSEPILEPRCWSRAVSFTFSGLSLALGIRDAVFWAQGAQVATFTVDILGGFVVVAGLIMSLTWLLMLKPWVMSFHSYTPTYSTSSRWRYGPSQPSKSSSSRSGGRGYSSRSGGRSGGSRATPGEWWNRMTRR